MFLSKQFGTIGRNSPVETSPIKSRSQSEIERISFEISLFKKLSKSLSFCCAVANSFIEIGGIDSNKALHCILLSQLATTLMEPVM